VQPEVREERPAVSLVGEIRPFDHVQVSSEVAGTVESVFVEVGDRVTAGQPLVQIDRDSFRMRLQQAEARVAAAKADLELKRRSLERKEDLLSDRTIPQATFDEAQALFDLAEASLLEAEATRDLAQRDYDKSIVRAPGAGAITVRTTAVGAWADVGMGLVELAVGARVKVVARVPSQWVPYLHGLTTFEFTVRAGEAPRTAKLYSVDPVVSEASRSFEVVGTAPGADLKPGLFANITLVSPEPVTTLWLPATAIMASDTPRVLMVENGETVVRKVQTGERDDGMIEVRAGLDADESVILDVAGLGRAFPVVVVNAS
jgi:RND family efflux transporter MFP subunit